MITLSINVIINFDRNVQVHHFNKRDNFRTKSSISNGRDLKINDELVWILHSTFAM